MRKAQPSDDYTRTDPNTGEVLHDQAGREIPDPNPMQPPLGYQRQDPLAVRIREMIIGHRLAEEARKAGAETFQEADDFEVGDDWEAEKHSPYETNFDPMTPEERAALSSQGKDVEGALTPEEKAFLTSKPPKKPARAATSGTPVSGALAEDQSDD